MSDTPRRLLSIVVPCFNEEDVLPLLTRELFALADSVEDRYDVEILLIDDGSRDGTWTLIERASASDHRLRGVRLSRNFGHQLALTCGHDLAKGDAIVSIDADLQDPPEVVHEMIGKWEEGADVVYAVRDSREGESAFKLWTADLFYRFIRMMGAKQVRQDSGDFRLMSRRALDGLNTLREQHRFIRGLVGWVGFRVAEVHYQRKARAAGVTKYPFLRMLRFAVDATVSLSFVPLRLAYLLAFGLSLILLAYLGYSMFAYLFLDKYITPGWSSLILSVIAFGSLNLLCIGIMGEYVGRIFEQVKNRPLYLIGHDTHETRVDGR